MPSTDVISIVRECALRACVCWIHSIERSESWPSLWPEDRELVWMRAPKVGLAAQPEPRLDRVTIYCLHILEMSGHRRSMLFLVLCM